MQLFAACLPYVAILKDSFREALASRVLWIALISICVVLLALVPLGLHTDRSVRLRQSEVVNPENLARALQAGASAPEAPAGHLWRLLNEDEQTRLQNWLNPATADSSRPASRHSPSARGQLVQMLNRLLQLPEFHQSPVWSTVALDADLAAALHRDDLVDADRSARNLQLLAAAFPRQIQTRSDPAISITYGGTAIVGPVDALPAQFRLILDQIILGVLSVFLGFLGVSGSLAVTANMIPQTFEPGEISLLLSKPISRSQLFLTKFLGGCAFTLLCAALLVTGLWAVLGLRLHVWRHELLWCIPIYVFLFAVYFSVSAVAGLIWRNSVVALVVVLMFWIGLFTINATRTLLEQNVIKARRIVELIPGGSETFAVDGSQAVLRWDSARQDWTEIFAQQDRPAPRLLGRLASSRGPSLRPVFDPTAERLLALQSEMSRFGGPGAATVVSGTSAGDWEREPEGRTPAAVFQLLLDSQHRVILPGPTAIYEFVGLSEQQKQAQQLLGNWLGGILRPSAGQAFRAVHPADMPAWAATSVCALDNRNDRLVIWSNGQLQRLDRQADGPYVMGPTSKLDSTAAAVVAAGGDHILLALADGSVRLLQQESLHEVARLTLPDGELPWQATAAPDGSWLVLLTHAGFVHAADTRTQQFVTPRLPGQGQISAMAFAGDGQLWTATGRRTATACSIASGQLGSVLPGTQDWICHVYDYAIRPLYVLLPKPSEMDNLVTWLITGEQSVTSGNASGGPGTAFGRDNLQQDRIALDVWTPLWSNLAFMSVVLGMGCLYVSRRDF